MRFSERFPRLSNPRQVFSCVGLVATAVTVSACESCDYPIVKETGAEIVVNGTIEAGKPADVAVYGQVGKGEKCPTSLQITYTEPTTPGASTQASWAEAEAAGKQSVTEANPKASGKPCRLTASRRALTVLAKGSKPRKVEISAVLKARGSEVIHRASASKTVTVNPPAGAQQQQPASEPKPTAAAPQGPVARIVAHREPLVEDDYFYLYPGASYASSGSIARYDWDLDNDGTFEHSSTTDDYQFEQQPDNTAGTSRTFRLRVTDGSGLQTTTSKTIPVRGAADTIVSYPDWPHGPFNVGDQRAVKPQSGGFVTDADTAELDWENDGVIEQTISGNSAVNNNAFTARTYTTPGPQVQRLQMSLGSKVANFFIVNRVLPAPRAGIAAKGRKLTVSLNSGNAKIKRRGKLRVVDNGFLVNGMRVTGRARGSVPKGTPKSLRGAFRTLASGRYAATVGGSATLLGEQVVNSGKATVLVRSAKSRKTQVCLSVTQPPGGGPGTLKVIGATGKAKGLSATGQTPPAIVGASGKTLFDKGILTARRGKAKNLTAACRSLARELDGKKTKRRKRS